MNWLQKSRPKRIHSSTSDESETSFHSGDGSSRQERKRQNTAQTDNSMAFQEAIDSINKTLKEALDSIDKRMENLSTKMDTEEIRRDV